MNHALYRRAEIYQASRMAPKSLRSFGFSGACLDKRNITHYIRLVIQKLRSRPLKRFYERDDASRIKANHVDTVRDILTRLDAASKPGDMDVPGFDLHPLKGKYKGFWAVTVKTN